MPKQSLDDYLVSKPEAEPSASVPLLWSHTVPSFRLGEGEMGLLAERVIGILSIEQ